MITFVTGTSREFWPAKYTTGHIYFTILSLERRASEMTSDRG
jgi:hypothetical protein